MPNLNDRKRDKHVTRATHKLFWQANFQDKPSLFIGYIFRIPGFLLVNSIIPLLSAYAIQAILKKDSAGVESFAVLIVGAGILYSIFIYIGETAIIRNAIRASRYIQRTIFENFLQKDYDFYANTYFGALGARATGLRDAYNLYGEIVTLTALRQVVIIVSSIIIIGLHSWTLAAITLLMMGIVLGSTVAISSYRVRFRREVSQASSHLAGQIGDSLTHGMTVKSFAMEDSEVRRLEQPLNVWERAQHKQWSSFVPADMIRMFLASVATAVLLIVSARLYIEGTITLPIVILLQLYVTRLIALTLDIAQTIKTYEQVMGAAYDPVRTMLVATTINDPPKPRTLDIITKQHRLQLQSITYHYEEAASKQQAIRKLTLDIKPGEKVGVVGYSGSGKTTLTKLLLRFMDVTEGSIMLDGIDLRELRQADLRTVISYVPQEPLLFHRSIAENIMYARSGATEADMKRVAKLAYVNEFVRDLPNGYDTFVGERGVKLSGGQRQRVAIARALLKDAPILVLDEATSALDSESERYIQEALWKLMAGRTALVIAHRLSTLRHMDRIIVMDKGAIVQDGTHEALLKELNGIYASLWKQQSGGYLGANAS